MHIHIYSMGLAMVGAPKILLLDEPCADVDPVARQQMQRVLRWWMASATRSVILTTQTMEMCEASS
jgi:ABC-type multidrug transport system ATPase subunit